MPVLELNGPEFQDIARQILGSGRRLRFMASGESMQPFIQNQDVLEVAPITGRKICRGDVLLVDTEDGRIIAHRVIKTNHNNTNSNYMIQADKSITPDGWFQHENILGRVVVVERGNQSIFLDSLPQKLKTQIWIVTAPLAKKFSWLPIWLRKYLRNWLLVR